MNYPKPIMDLIKSFSLLPSIGSRGATRLCMHLLEKDRAAGLQLARDLENAMKNIRQCNLCYNFSESDLCEVCKDPSRDNTKLCIVAMPMDVLSIEQTGYFKGSYFVLMGLLSPLDGVGAEDLKLSELSKRLDSKDLQEIILALAPTPEGDATCHYVNQIVKSLSQKSKVKITRISYGIPFGGSLDYTDVHTLSHALQTRMDFAFD